ncbi:MAG: hypothetical protein AAGU74_12810 [Bacillota bacterium]
MITKKYFGVRAYLSPDRVLAPIMIEDEHGQIYDVKIVRTKRLDDFTTRFTVLVGGREARIFHELDSGKWYMLRGSQRLNCL